MNQHTRYIEVNKGYATIRLDEVGTDTLVTVYNVNVKDIDLLIEKLQAVKAEHTPKPATTIEYDENDEPKAMVAVMGKKVDPTAWYGNALRKQAAELTKQDAVKRTIVNRTAQGFSPKAVAHQVNKELKK